MRDWGWFIIIQKTRGLIGLPNPEEELRLLEEKANATYGEYQAALNTTANLEGQMGDLKDEIAAMSKQLSEEQGNISVYTDRQAKSSPLPKEKIGRTRTACLNLLQSSKGRSKPTNSR